MNYNDKSTLAQQECNITPSMMAPMWDTSNDQESDGLPLNMYSQWKSTNLPNHTNDKYLGTNRILNDSNPSCEETRMIQLMMVLEPRLQEYVKKKSFYEKNNINIEYPLEKTHNISKQDLIHIQKLMNDIKQKSNCIPDCKTTPKKPYWGNTCENKKTYSSIDNGPKNTPMNMMGNSAQMHLTAKELMFRMIVGKKYQMQNH
jgi:hypothetical protein